MEAHIDIMLCIPIARWTLGFLKNAGKGIVFKDSVLYVTVTLPHDYRIKGINW